MTENSAMHYILWQDGKAHIYTEAGAASLCGAALNTRRRIAPGDPIDDLDAVCNDCYTRLADDAPLSTGLPTWAGRVR